MPPVLKVKSVKPLEIALAKYPLSQQLATIDCQLAKVHPDALIRQTTQSRCLKELYQRFEFNGLLASVDASALPTLDEQSETKPHRLALNIIQLRQFRHGLPC